MDCGRWDRAVAFQLSNGEFNALKNHTGEFTPFADGPAAKQDMQAWGDRNRQLDLVFASGGFDHTAASEQLKSTCRDALWQLKSDFRASHGLLVVWPLVGGCMAPQT